MASVAVVPNFRTAVLGEFDADVACIQTLGYFDPGDGGGAVYGPAVAKTARIGGLQSGDGRWWRITGGQVDVRQFGATGDGVTDDTAAIQAALDCPSAATIMLSPGRYRALGLVVRRTCTLAGSSAELIGGGSGAGDLMTVSASGFEVRRLTLRGDCYADFESPIAPDALIRVSTRRQDDAPLEKLSLVDVDLIGGRIGCFIGLVSDILIERMRIEDCRDYGLILASGPSRIIISGFIARGIGLYGGIKTSYNGATRATEKFILTDFIVETSGRLHPDPMMWQEGLDLTAAYAKQFVISNGVIADCGNGAIELKTGAMVTDELDETYEDIVVNGVIMDVVGDFHAVALNWTGRKTNTEKRGRKVLITNCTIRFSKADLSKTDSSGVMITAWSDVSIINNVIEGCGAAVILSGQGADDDTVRSVVIAGNQIRGVGRGIYSTVGRVEDLRISHNSIYAHQNGIMFAGPIMSKVRIMHNDIVQYGFQKYGDASCIFMSDCNLVDILYNTLTSTSGHAVLVIRARPVTVGGEIAGNHVSVEQDAFRLEAGHWTVLQNRLRLPPRRKTVLSAADAVVTAGWNVRGIGAAPPLASGSLGDIFFAAASRPEHALGWRLVLDEGPSGAAWRAIFGERDEVEPALIPGSPGRARVAGLGKRLRRLSSAVRRGWFHLGESIAIHRAAMARSLRKSRRL